MIYNMIDCDNRALWYMRNYIYIYDMKYKTDVIFLNGYIEIDRR